MAYTCQRYSGLIVAVFGHTLMREKHAVGCATLEVALLVRDTRSDGVIVLCAISGVPVLALALLGRRKLALLPTFVEVLGMLVSYAASLDSKLHTHKHKRATVSARLWLKKRIL